MSIFILDIMSWCTLFQKRTPSIFLGGPWKVIRLEPSTDNAYYQLQGYSKTPEIFLLWCHQCKICDVSMWKEKMESSIGGGHYENIEHMKYFLGIFSVCVYVSEIKSILSIIFYAMYGALCFSLPILLLGLVIKQCHALYALICFNGTIHITINLLLY